MDKLAVDEAYLREFERMLNPRDPESGPIPTKILGYGEISSVLKIGVPRRQMEFAYKRMPMFASMGEAESYDQLYQEYMRILEQEIGIQVPDEAISYFRDHRGQWVTVYVVQEMLQPASIGNKLVHSLADKDVERLFTAVIEKIQQVFVFNRRNRDILEIGFDGQISNWAVANLTNEMELPSQPKLVYFDTNTPLLRKSGEEQLKRELFLRSAPSFLYLFIRLFFLDEVSARYYDLRTVIIDLFANLYKEQRADLVPRLLSNANLQLADDPGYEPVSVAEIERYYREDAFIWRLYLFLRKFDRRLHELRGKPYPFILPDKIQR